MKIIAFEWRTGGALSNSMTLKKKKKKNVVSIPSSDRRLRCSHRGQ